MLVAQQSHLRTWTMRIFSLVVDKANYFAFKVDDIEEAHSHVNFQSLATDRAAYQTFRSVRSGSSRLSLRL